ncbi:MAG: sigma factor-like helix-turn-helix DNA-binding protein [Candidatus Sulfotelmatobacter sp.]
MSGFVVWDTGHAVERDSEESSLSDSGLALPPMDESSGQVSEIVGPTEAFLEALPVHDFSKQKQNSDETKIRRATNSYWDRDPDLWMYRKKTAALLRRYMRWSIEAGRLPSLLGRELFRAKVTAYKATTFEDRVIFIHDIERCLNQLASFDREIVARVVLQEHEHPQAARILHCTRRTIERRLPEVLDELSEAFLKARLLDPLPEVKEEETL